MVAGKSAHVVIAPPICPKCVVVELKREIVEGKGGLSRVIYRQIRDTSFLPDNGASNAC
jgi:hypothetical protein